MMRKIVPFLLLLGGALLLFEAIASSLQLYSERASMDEYQAAAPPDEHSP
jgi:hypothetical protein